MPGVSRCQSGTNGWDVPASGPDMVANPVTSQHKAQHSARRNPKPRASVASAPGLAHLASWMKGTASVGRSQPSGRPLISRTVKIAARTAWYRTATGGTMQPTAVRRWAVSTWAANEPARNSRGRAGFRCRKVGGERKEKEETHSE